MHSLAELRRAKGWSQKQLASRLELSTGAIGNYEAGIRTPRLSTAKAIARLFNVRVDDLAFRTPEQEPRASAS